MGWIVLHWSYAKNNTFFVEIYKIQTFFFSHSYNSHLSRRLSFNSWLLWSAKRMPMPIRLGRSDLQRLPGTNNALHLCYKNVKIQLICRFPSFSYSCCFPLRSSSGFARLSEWRLYSTIGMQMSSRMDWHLMPYSWVNFHSNGPTIFFFLYFQTIRSLFLF